MEARSRKLYRDYGVYVNQYTLRNFYRRNRVSYTKPQPCYRQDLQNSERLQVRRVEYARRLAELVVANAPIVYADETSVHVWMTQSRCWQPRDSPVNVVLNKKRHPGVTVYGAIGSCLKEPVMMLGSSTNAVEFQKFLILVVEQFQSEKTRPWLVIDNHNAHLDPASRRLIEEHFHPFNIPAYSSRFNSIGKRRYLLTLV